MTFGYWLRREIENRLMTVKEFAEAVGVTNVHASRWINDHVLPNGINVVRIARVLDVSREQVERRMGKAPAAA